MQEYCLDSGEYNYYINEKMSTPPSGRLSLVQGLASLLRNCGDTVLEGTSTLTLQAAGLQHLTHLFEQHLLSRKHQHGFLALPSHPADTASMLQVQFLFDMLQKTISLKLFNPSESKIQSPVKIFPFKSLKYLELKRIPPHCLEGLRAVYSQLEVFICSKSVHSLEELISSCGGDLSSALPWLELHTLNFSYNSITALDNSLSLLNVLKSLDLSHNKIQECADYLLPLCELKHLNLGYNFLTEVPTLSPSCRAKLVTLILRNNELESINGVEHLSSLKHLDLTYNLLLEHTQLAPLSQLHCLNQLNLEGNPLYFQSTHRATTVRHISPKAAFLKLKLDGSTLSFSELAVLPKPGQLIGRALRSSSQEVILSEKGIQEVSSGGGDMSDSMSQSESGAARLSRKKSKSKIKVRRASISEPSDTDHDHKSQYTSLDIVLRHQKEIEQMDSFRDQLGEDWLRYTHHLQEVSEAQPKAGPSSSSLTVSDHSPNSKQKTAGSPRKRMRISPDQRLNGTQVTSEPGEAEPEVEESESTLEWEEHSQEGVESVLEGSEPTLEECVLQEFEREAMTEKRREEEEDEEDDLEVDLCHPLVVGVVPDGEFPESGGSRLFLRVKPRHAVEVDLQSARVLARLELDSLREVNTSQAAWREKGREENLPSLELHFSYISRDRQRRRYVMLDENPQQALQSLTEAFSKIAEENVQKLLELEPESVRLQCLKCKLEFSPGKPEEQRRLHSLNKARGEELEEWAETAGTALVCPACTSDHVVQLASQSKRCTSSLVPTLSERTSSMLQITFVDSNPPTEEQGAGVWAKSPMSSSPRENIPVSEDNGTDDDTLKMNEHSNVTETDSLLMARNLSFYIGEEETVTEVGRDSWRDEGHEASFNIGDSQLASFCTADPSTPVNKRGSFTSGTPGEILCKGDSLAGSYTNSMLVVPKPPSEYGEESSEAQYNLFTGDFQRVDHRLKLFFDVEVFEEDTEELQCFLKLSTVKFGDAEEVPSLLVVSDHWIHVLVICSEIQGQPSDWLRKRESHRIAELSYLEVGLGSQSIRAEFEDSGAAYTLLIRDREKCESFFNLLTGIVRGFAHNSDSKLKSISTTRVNPQHHLWPLLCENAESDISEDSHLHFFYLLAFLVQDGSLAPVTVLVTQATLYLLSEDHQWRKGMSSQTSNENTESISGTVHIHETQPISCVSSVHLFLSSPYRVDIKLYDEIAKDEKTWCLQTESQGLVKDLVEWVRTQWEAMFGVKLNTTLHKTGS
ncbi:serine/threonine-protein kinase 11-interacting protein-like isoform X1 [Acipenser ruthenus]|uniref:serine/threonine-protein kinase 11-interacting protein-like isoform X1 n=2 Tax=Acipenser ruthenus TaxID=7906 RepID=UPI00145B2B67|nr:serine/threonine-protein kinase 11-interacting protein-like isoform X1 [Acipenser ruthenus]